MPDRPIAHLRFSWLLWLALLVPTAQLAATWHVQSHWGAEQTTTPDGKHALAGDHCDLCLTAAAVTGGAATSTPLPVALPLAPRAGLQSGASLTWAAAVSLAYESRAPPRVFR